MRKLLLSFGVLASAFAGAQYNFAWQKHFDGPLAHEDNVQNMAMDALGNCYVVGSVNWLDADPDAQVLKYDPAGNLVWSQRINGEASGQDLGFGIALGGDGSVNVICRTVSNLTSSDLLTVKFNANTGAILWSRTYDGPAHSVDDGFAIAADTAGNVFVVGEVWNDAEFYSNGDYVTIKYDASGNLVWDRLFDGPANWIAISDQPVALALDLNGDVIVTGNSPDINNSDDWATLKYRGTDGTLLWQAHYSSGVSGVPTSLVIGSDNDVFVGGSQDAVVIARYDGATGAQKWVIEDGFPHAGRLRNRWAMTVDSLNNPAIAVTYDGDSDDSNLNNNVQTTKYNAIDGTRMWTMQYGGLGDLDGQYAGQVLCKPNGNVLMIGVERLGPAPYKFLFLEYENTTGGLVWNGTYVDPVGQFNPIQSIFDPNGNLLVACNARSSANNIDMSVAKFATASVLRPILISVGPSPAWGGSSPVGRVQLSGRPGDGGQVVTLSENSSFVSVPPSVLVAKGALTATFPISTNNPTYSQTITLTARIGSVSTTKAFILNKIAMKSLVLNSTSVSGGASTSATVILNGPAPVGGFSVSITDNSVRVSGPQTIVVPAGANSASFTINTLAVPAPVTCTIRAYGNGATGTAVLTVNP